MIPAPTKVGCRALPLGERRGALGASILAILVSGTFARSEPSMGGSSIDLLDPMSRESSGTSWQPDSSPLFARMWMRGGNMLMLHGEIWPRYTWVGSRRGDSRVDAPSWAMAMFSHPLEGRSQLGAHLMMSLDPLLEGRQGYPLLFQTAETAFWVPLHDRQHPHNRWAELSSTYSYALDRRRSGRPRSCTAYRRRTIRTPRSRITGRIPLTSTSEC